MSYEFKKLGAVEALTEMPENANALVEVDGAIKRVPAGSLVPAPSEVVILPETEIVVNEAKGFITTPLSATPTDGATAEITYNGTKYTSPIVYTSEDGIDMYAMGNLSDMGIPGGGNPDAPFMVALIPNGMDGAYGIVMTMQGVTNVTLSIVQVGAASGGAVEVDATLTKAGTAADAKVVGDRFTSLSEEMAGIAECKGSSSTQYVTGWTVGRIDSGTHKDSNAHAYSSVIANDGVAEYTFDSETYKILLIVCNEDGEVHHYYSWKSESPLVVDSTYPKYILEVGTYSGRINDEKLAELSETVYRGNASYAPIVEKVLNNEQKIGKISDRISAVYVDAVNGLDTNDGSRATPFKTIQKGVDSGAKIVYVATGEYADSVAISNRNEITIMPTTYDSAYVEGVENTPKIVLNGGRLSAVDSGNVTVIGVHCCNLTTHGFVLNRTKNAKLIDCIASACTGEGVCGFKVQSTNGTFVNCSAYNVTLDGFNMHGYGNTDFINCIAYDCGDDGISHHDGCTGSVVGGEYYNCGKGGVSSPTYGAYVDVRHVYSHDNRYGLYAVSDDTHRDSKGKVIGCVFKNNTSQDLYISRSQIVGWQNIYDTKSVAETAVFTEIPTAQ